MNPKVSVCLITYNHEKFISQALIGIINQVVDFEYEIVVGDDCSIDATGNIVEEFAGKYPDKIKYQRHNKNVGMIGNWIHTIQSCKGEYIAIIEGDDYWTDPQKLSLQVSLLDRHPEYSLCFHKLGIKAEGKVNQHDFYLDRNLEKSVYTIEDVIQNKWFIGSCSMMVRNGYWKTFPPNMHTLKAIDKMVQLIAADKGNIAYINREMGIYRIHPQGISQQQWLGKENIFEFATIALLNEFDGFSSFKYHTLLLQQIEKAYLSLLSKNMLLSKPYIKAFWGLMKRNKRIAFEIIRDIIIVKLIPDWMYRHYYRSKKTIISDK